MLIGLIVFLTVGILFFVLGLLIWKKQKINLIHEYHIRSVKQEDVPAYTRLMGIGMLAIGTGCVITGAVVFIFEKPLGWIAFPVGFLAGLVIFLKAQKTYNGGLFS